MRLFETVDVSLEIRIYWYAGSAATHSRNRFPDIGVVA